MRIAIGGISHETNTFSPVETDLEAFEKGDEAARAILKENTEIIRYLQTKNVEAVPIFYADALPSGIVKKKAYQHMKDKMLEEIESNGKLDGICLLLHGAMEIEDIGNGEIDIVKSIRKEVGTEPIISISLDLHGNIPPEITDHADIITAYRTAPHRDATETRKKAATLLVKSIKKGRRPETIITKPPIILPGEFAVTDIEPSLTLYKRLEEIDKTKGILDSSLLIGMAWADTPNTGGSTIVVAEQKKYRKKAQEIATEIAEDYWKKRKEFHLEVPSGTIDEIIMSAKKSPKQPIFISDSGDNIGAGAPGDTPIILKHLIHLKAKNTVIAGIVDRTAVEDCRKTGEGNTSKIEIGGKIDIKNATPLAVHGKVQKLFNDAAVFNTDGIEIILTKERRPFVTTESIEKYGINPIERKIIIVKLGYLFPDLRNKAALSLMALTPGCTNLQIEELNYTKIKRPIFPLDKDFQRRPTLDKE